MQAQVFWWGFGASCLRVAAEGAYGFQSLLRLIGFLRHVQKLVLLRYGFLALILKNPVLMVSRVPKTKAAEPMSNHTRPLSAPYKTRSGILLCGTESVYLSSRGVELLEKDLEAGASLLNRSSYHPVRLAAEGSNPRTRTAIFKPT